MGAIHLKTEVPGPRSRELMARRTAAVPRGPFHATPVFVARRPGARSWTSTATSCSTSRAASAA